MRYSEKPSILIFQSQISRTPTNTIPTEMEGNIQMRISRKSFRTTSWNAAAIVSDANRRVDGIGGHISTYASSSTLYEVGFNHVFRGKNEGLGDAIYIQGHGSPGIYARAFLEGRISREQLKKFRQEVSGEGLSSYPHPRLMPDFWEYPTVSMGLGPLAAVLHASSGNTYTTEVGRHIKLTSVLVPWRWRMDESSPLPIARKENWTI